MENNLIKASIGGHIRMESVLPCEYTKKVHISFDDVTYDINSDVNIWVQIESPSILDMSKKLIENKDKYDLILAFNENILKECNNSEMFIFGTTWLDLGTLKLNKKNEISFIMSEKNQTAGHIMRHEIWREYYGKNNINGFELNFMKTPPRIPFKNPLFENAKFSIAVENCISNSYLTEKVLDCFLSKTIPIYYGCHNIGDFFNKRGVLQFNNISELNNILLTINPKMYDDLLDVVEENFNIAQKYKNLYERVDNKVKEFIINKYGK